MSDLGGGRPAPLVSIIVNIYNHERYLADCVRSVLALAGGYDFEVILMDDASPDGCERIARSFDDPRIRYVRNDANLGADGAINRAFGLARGRLVARIDGDDRYRPGFLEHTVPVLMRRPDVGLVCGQIVTIDRDGQATSDEPRVTRERTGDRFADLLRRNFISAPTVLARREAWQAALPVPPGMQFFDWYLSLRIAQRWAICELPQVLADYRVHPANMHTKMIADRSGERITLQVLGQVFADPHRAAEKRDLRAAAYGEQYLELAEKYFGAGMEEDARRCYGIMLRHRSALLLRPGVFRHLLGARLGMRRYENLKRRLKALMGQS